MIDIRSSTIKTWLIERGLSIADFCRLSGLAYGSLYNQLQKDVARISFPTAHRICRELNIEPAELLKDGERVG